MKRHFRRILGIETSCDDTAAEILHGNKILSQVVSSQWDLNNVYGGVVPNLAVRAHSANIIPVLEKVKAESRIDYKELDAVAVTTGPGLLPCLKVGHQVARKIAEENQIPLIGVNHLLGHSLVPRLQAEIEFPYLLLLISGGHCALTLAKGIDNYLEIGSTLDDSIGEAFDKVGRLIGVSSEHAHYGSELERLAIKGDSSRLKLTTPLQKRVDCNFSFSGLKSSIARIVDKNDIYSKYDIAASFQQAAFKHVVQRTRRALILCNCIPCADNAKVAEMHLFKKEHKRLHNHFDLPITNVEPNAVVVSGGVASNRALREQLKELCKSYKIPCVFPPINLCTDNGVMIAWAAAEILCEYGSESQIGQFFRICATDEEINQLDIRAQWPLDNMKSDCGNKRK